MSVNTSESLRFPPEHYFAAPNPPPPAPAPYRPFARNGRPLSDEVASVASAIMKGVTEWVEHCGVPGENWLEIECAADFEHQGYVVTARVKLRG